MKTVLRILQIVLASAAAVLALVFLIIEGRTLFAGDWLLHQQPAAGFLQYLLRTLIAAGVLFSSVRTILKKRTALFENLCIAVSCIVMAILLPNGLGFLFLIPALLSLAVGLFV